MFATGVSSPVDQEVNKSSEPKPVAAVVVFAVDLDDVEVFATGVSSEYGVEIRTGFAVGAGVEVCVGESV